MSDRIRPTALIEDGARIGPRTAIWDQVHIRAPSTIGADCIIGEKTYIAYQVSIGDRVKINAQVYICAGVTIETGVMVSAGVIFTNDKFPRATTPDLASLLPSEPGEDMLQTRVAEGATLGAGAVIGPGIHIGRFAVVGMGSVVTRSVPDYHLVFGNPARFAGVVCRCGRPLMRAGSGTSHDAAVRCSHCDRTYTIRDGSSVEEAS